MVLDLRVLCESRNGTTIYRSRRAALFNSPIGSSTQSYSSYFGPEDAQQPIFVCFYLLIQLVTSLVG